jgi:leucyl aminopeptidase
VWHLRQWVQGQKRIVRATGSCLVRLPFALPEGVYALASALEGQAAETFALGWLLGSYRFTRYADGAQARAQLVAPAGVDAARVEAIAAGECLTRDLINTPTAGHGARTP